jgi:hypothetical protein
MMMVIRKYSTPELEWAYASADFLFRNRHEWPRTRRGKRKGWQKARGKGVK